MQEACRRLVNGESKSAFVTSFVSPQLSFYFMWWVCYREGEAVYIQNQMMHYEQLPSAFVPESLYDYVEDRKTVTDEGLQVSEWKMPLQWVREFLK